jgi:epoxide hydrolase-like predicted phosphatase
MAIAAVVFDVGGVLEVNPRTRWQERWATRLNMPVAQFDRRLGVIWAPGSVGRSSLEEIECQTAAAFDLDDDALAALMNDAWSEYVGSLNHELAEYFERLCPRYKTGILSNSFVGAREREQQAHRLGDICDVTVYSHEEGCLKPEQQIYRIACDRLDVAPESAVFLDDVEENVKGARAIGMTAIVFSTNAQAISELQALLAD